MITKHLIPEGVRVTKEHTGVYRISFDPGNSWDRAAMERRANQMRSRGLPKRLGRKKRKLLRSRLLAPVRFRMGMTIWDDGNTVISSVVITGAGYIKTYP